MWTKLKTWCWHSLTMAWAYLQIAAAAVLLYADQILGLAAKAASDPVIAEKINALTPPAWLGYVVGAMGAITLLARLRSLLKAT